jgi:hypothetical protein
MKRIIKHFFPPLQSFAVYLTLENAQTHIGRRIYSTGCFREVGTLLREDIEAIAILERARRMCL